MEYNLLATTSLEKCGVVKYGKFTLKSGETSDIYFNFKKIIAYPDICRSICDSIHKLIILSKCDYICGIPQGAIHSSSVLEEVLVLHVWFAHLKWVIYCILKYLDYIVLIK